MISLLLCNSLFIPLSASCLLAGNCPQNKTKKKANKQNPKITTTKKKKKRKENPHSYLSKAWSDQIIFPLKTLQWLLTANGLKIGKVTHHLASANLPELIFSFFPYYASTKLALSSILWKTGTVDTLPLSSLPLKSFQHTDIFLSLASGFLFLFAWGFSLVLQEFAWPPQVQPESAGALIPWG